ncbi:hypothetical protein [Variovorax ginsengisoli]|uniref:Uncharacterized protein n=1 Tax=Variovorax ginsengisoli TaxID=363844 RepID=A0ABT8S867_9BURK|nr:hypothetical protein [Variovorax ginsengisoli]MDN8615493.1 hypothetical protein [Variovorax ginsengisoli]MDO1534663.1 hypothetical protein [Variovorax ginsengisoli]
MTESESSATPSAHEMVRDLAVAMEEVVAGLSDRIKKLDGAVRSASYNAANNVTNTFETLVDRIAELEERKAASMVFKGAFNRTMSYQPGDLVTLNDRLYVAAKAIEPGEHLRDGADGWVKIFSKGQNHD